jgi:hypothetical protein
MCGIPSGKGKLTVTAEAYSPTVVGWLLIRFCQWLQRNQATPTTITTPIAASNLWKYCPSSRQFWPSFIPSQAKPRHHGHDPRKV